MGNGCDNACNGFKYFSILITLCSLNKECCVGIYIEEHWWTPLRVREVSQVHVSHKPHSDYDTQGWEFMADTPPLRDRYIFSHVIVRY